VREWIECDDGIDTILVSDDWVRGVYPVNDSLMLTTGMRPYDESVCDTLSSRFNYIGSEPVCNLGDLYPPFEIYKIESSDTLYVIKDQISMPFRFPSGYCDE
jgi:hypothetical protein